MSLQSKFSTVTLSCQSGKSAQVLCEINSIQEKDLKDSRGLHVIFTQNLLLNAMQFFTRVTTSLKNNSGVITVVASSFKNFPNDIKKNSKFRFVKQLSEVDLKTTSVILTCKNYVRINSFLDKISKIEESPGCVNGVYVYFDELHQSLDSANKKKDPKRISNRELIERLCEMSIVREVVGMTATPQRVFNKSALENWGAVKQALFTPPNLEGSYYKLSEMNFTEIKQFVNDSEEEGFISSKYVKFVLDNNPEILKDNARVFAPALVYRDSHDELQELFLDRRWDVVTVILNGHNKTLSFYSEESCKLAEDLTTIDLTKASKGLKELNETIADVMNLYGLFEENRPLVITGYTCVGIGMTLTNEKIGSFTAAIFNPQIMNGSTDSLYQLVGRLASRSKGWSTFNETTIYTSKAIYNTAIGMEKSALEIGLNHKNKMVTKAQYLQPFKEYIKEQVELEKNIHSKE